SQLRTTVIVNKPNIQLQQSPHQRRMLLASSTETESTNTRKSLNKTTRRRAFRVIACLQWAPNSKIILPPRRARAACSTAVLISLRGYDFSTFVCSNARPAISKIGLNAAIRSDAVAWSYHLLIQTPR